MVGHLSKVPRGSSRAAPIPALATSPVSSLGDPDITRVQDSRQMGQREMGSPGHLKATDSNAQERQKAPPALSRGIIWRCPLLSHPK